MEKGLGILDQINKAFWKKKAKEEVTKKNDVEIDGLCLEGAETSSEYWSQLSNRSSEKVKRKGSAVSGGEDQAMGNQESEPKAATLIYGSSDPPEASKDKKEVKKENASKTIGKNGMEREKVPSNQNSKDQSRTDLTVKEERAGDPSNRNEAPNVPETQPDKEKQQSYLGAAENANSISSPPKVEVKEAVSNPNSKVSTSLTSGSSEIAATEVAKNDGTPRKDANPVTSGNNTPPVESKDVNVALSKKNSLDTTKTTSSVVSESIRDVLSNNSELAISENSSRASGGTVEVQLSLDVPGAGLSTKPQLDEVSPKPIPSESDLNVENSCVQSPEEQKKKTVRKTKTVPVRRKASTDVLLDNTPLASSPTRRMSEVPKASRGVNSGATSPEGGSRRDSGAMSPLSFNSIQEKILALSRESSVADVPRKRAPKVKKLDETMLAVVKEPPKEKPKEVVKVTPKIDSVLQTKILKFGAPSTGAKIPVKRAETTSCMSYSAVGGYAIKGEAEDKAGKTKSEPDPNVPMTPKGTKKVKARAPLPPGSEPPSKPSTPSTERKGKKVKGKAPLPPTIKTDDITNLSSEITNLLEQTEAFSKQIQNLSVQSKEADIEALSTVASNNVIGNSSENGNDASSLNDNRAVTQIGGTLIPENKIKDELPKNDKKMPALSEGKLPADVKKEDSNKDVQDRQSKGIESSPKSNVPETEIEVTTTGTIPSKKQDFSSSDGSSILLKSEKTEVGACVISLNNEEKISSVKSEVVLEIKSNTEGGGVKNEDVRISPNPSEKRKPLEVPNEPPNKSNDAKAVAVAVWSQNNDLDKTEKFESQRKENKDQEKLENASYVSDWNNKIPDHINGNADSQFLDENDEFYEDCETPKASRKLLHLYGADSDSRSQWSDIMDESLRVQAEMQRTSRRLGDSSGSESFHTPSPRPLMFTSRGEVIGDSRDSKGRSPEWTPSPDRDLFTPEGSPLSDFSDASYDHYVASVDFSVRSVSLPRRVYPQTPRPASYHEDWKEESPVVFDAGLSFDLCSRRTPVRQHLRACPAHTEPKTASNSLSCRIAEFLSRTDHVMDEWRRLGRADPKDMQSLVELPNHRVSGAARSKSAANIMIKGFQYFSRGSSRTSWRSPSTSRFSEASDRTLADLEELNEMAADLAEERLSGAQAGERLEAETSERIRLEQELAQMSNKKSQLEQAAERMELELHYAKAYDNCISDGEGDFGEGRDDGDVHKRKCARLKRENDMLRQQLRQQHEDDLEQLVGLKKQLEKRLADANEEIDEQRQVAAEWKRKSQKLQAELNDFRIIVEEQNSRNTLLEKKQRKFDAEIQMLQDELRSEKNAKERFSRDREVAVSSKCTIEQTLASVRLELELKEEEVKRLTRDLEDLSLGGASEQDITQLRKAKHDMEKKIKEQDDELDDLAGQVSLLESAKLKLEMTIESIRKEHRKEISQKDDEIEDIRSNSMKKLKSAEAALEQEYEERSMLLRGKHELERRLKELEEHDRSTRAADEDALVRLRRDLRKTKALLRDAQVMLDRAKEDSPGKAALRALKNQLEDTELARASAVKAKQKLAAELSETTSLLEDANRMKGEAESRAQAAARQVNTLKTQLEENEEELSELMKKYNQHLATEEARNQEAAATLAEVETERNSLREQLAEATARLESMTVADPAPDMNQRRLEITIQDLKSRLELDGAVRKRLEVQISRLKEKMERLSDECNQYRIKEQTATDQVRKLQVSLRECKEELAVQVAREQDAVVKRRDLEKRLEAAEAAASAARAEVKLSAQRVQDLQAALTAEINSESEESSDGESG